MRGPPYEKDRILGTFVLTNNAQLLGTQNDKNFKGMYALLCRVRTCRASTTVPGFALCMLFPVPNMMNRCTVWSHVAGLRYAWVLGVLLHTMVVFFWVWSIFSICWDDGAVVFLAENEALNSSILSTSRFLCEVSLKVSSEVLSVCESTACSGHRSDMSIVLRLPCTHFSWRHSFCPSYLYLC